MKKLSVISVLSAIAIAVSSMNTVKNTAIARETQEENWVLTWSDEFDGDTLDMSKWSYDTGNWIVDENGSYVTSGWGNNEQQFYTDKNAVVSDGTLKIRAKKETYTDSVQGTYEYTSSKILTKNKFSVCYGKIDIRARVDSGKSLWPAIWMLPEDSVYGEWASSGELDIMEGWGSNPGKICGTIHFGNKWPGNAYLTNDYYFENGDSSENWHIYTIEWEEGEIRWYVDGNLFSVQNEWNSDGRAFPAPFDQNFYMILNLAVGGHFDGIDGVYADPATFADGHKELEVDYVRVYQKDGITYTPSAPSQKPMNEYFIEGGQGSLSNTGNGTTVYVSDTGTMPYSVMATIENQEVKKGKTYFLDFDIVSSADRNMVVTVENSAYDRFFEKEIGLNGTRTHYHFECSFENDEKADIKFQLGNTGDVSSIGIHEVVISNLRFTESGVSDVTMPSSESGAWLKPYFIEGGAGSLLNSFEGTRIKISDTGSQTYSVMANLDNIYVEKGVKYELDFDISSSAGRAVNVTFENTAYDRYFDKMITLTPTSVHYHFDCIFEKNDIADLKFLLGDIENASSLGEHSVLISNLSFVKEGTRPQTTTTVVVDDKTVYGDANLDGNIDLTDLTCISLHCIGDALLKEQALKNADVTADGTVDLADLATMKQYISKEDIHLGK